MEQERVTNLALGFRFEVTFFVGGKDPNKVDIRFQRVSGLTAEVKTTTVVEGGENLYTHRLPERVDYGNLVLERGFVVDSRLNDEFDEAMRTFRFKPSTVQVILYAEDESPLASWLFIKAYPVRWSTADLDANDEKVVIDTMELAYARMQMQRFRS